MRTGKKINVAMQRYRHYSGKELATYFDSVTGSEFVGPRQYLEYLAETKGSGQNSLDAAAYDLLLFTRYPHQCAAMCLEHDIESTAPFLTHLLRMYPSFLAEAECSSIKFVSAVAKELKFSGLAKSSVSRYLGTINGFLEFNESDHQIQLAGTDEIDHFVSQYDLRKALGNFRPLSYTERTALTAKSMLAGVINGDPQKIKRPHVQMPSAFKSTGNPIKSFADKAFPAGSLLELIDKSKTYRDKVLFSVMSVIVGQDHESLKAQLSTVLTERSNQERLLMTNNQHNHSQLMIEEQFDA